jgi:hypothetical protein
MVVRFKAANTNTGACTINVEGLGNISFTQPDGTAFAASEIIANNYISAIYESGNNRFELVSNTTPEAVGAADPDQFAIYSDAGSSSIHTLTVVSGYTAPSAFTDQTTVWFRSNSTNDGVGAHPINVVGLGSKDVVEIDGSNPQAGRITAGSWVLAIFREARDAFELVLVSEIPQPSINISVEVTSSSGTLFNVSSLPEYRAPLAYIDGMIVTLRAPQGNTGSLSMNLNGLGSKSVRNLAGSNFASSAISGNDLIIAQYIESEDRFRAAVIASAPINPDTINRDAKISSPSQTNITTTSTVTLDFPSAPSSDPLSFYDATEDTFIIPSNVEAVDIVLDIQGSFQGGTDDTAAILGEVTVGGVRQGSASARFSQGGEHVCVTALGVAVTPGQTINGRITKSGTGTYTLNSATNMFVRASRVAS